MHRCSLWIRLCALVGVSLAIVACGSDRRAQTTRFRVSDVEFSADQLRAELLSSELLASRGRDSDAVVIMAGDAVNLSTERLPEADRWAVVSMILYDPEVQAAFETKNVHVHLPPAKRALFERYVLPGSGIDPFELPPDTHLLNVWFRSIQRAAAVEADTADARKDLFVIEAEITELSSGHVVWSGTSRFARAARGRLLD